MCERSSRVCVFVSESRDSLPSICAGDTKDNPAHHIRVSSFSPGSKKECHYGIGRVCVCVCVCVREREGGGVVGRKPHVFQSASVVPILSVVWLQLQRCCALRCF